jgi:hypothetical protein
MRATISCKGVIAAAGLVAALVLAAPAAATTYNVSTTSQLESALNAANANSGLDTIVMAPGTYVTGTDLEVMDDLIVQGDPGAPTIVDGNGTFAVWDIGEAVSATLQTMTIRNADIGIDSFGPLDVSRVTITAINSAAVELDRAASQITNSTISNNPGTGIDQESCRALALTNVTIAGNAGGGINVGCGAVSAFDTIIAGNTPSDCIGTLGSQGGSSVASLDSDGSCGVNITADPRLGPLASNGGPTQTRELFADSPAIDAGAAGCPAADQRGVARVGACDIGAYELDPSHSDGNSATVGPGGTVTTGSDATSSDPIETSVTTPTGGQVSIEESAGGSFSLGSWHVQISAPPATAANPLKIVFLVDSTLVPAGGVAAIPISKNGTLVAECPGSTTASPDPCVSNRTLLANGDAQITVLTSTASDWTFSGSTPPPPAGPVKVRGHGELGAGHSKKTFRVSANSTKHGPRGSVDYRDGSVKPVLKLKAKSISSISCSAGHAVIKGTGEVNGQPVDFTIDVFDGGKKSQDDTFAISWPSYSASGPLSHGAIEVAGC